MTVKKRLITKAAVFEGVHCSGLWFRDPSLVTAVSLLFEKVHILNHLEYVIDFANRFRLEIPSQPGDIDVKIEPLGEYGPEESDPFRELTPTQRRTAYAYLFKAGSFTTFYSELFGEVFQCSLLQDNEPWQVELLRKGDPGELNTYRVKPSPLIVSLGARHELDQLVSRGAIPILGMSIPGEHAVASQKRRTARYLASLLAMKSVDLVLPQTKPAPAETILEARLRLKDYLPPSWSGMLKLSSGFKAQIDAGVSEEDLLRECQDMVDTTVRPALIDLTQKMLKERRHWFHRILRPIGSNMKVMLGKPPLTTADLASSGLAFGANVTIDVANEMLRANLTSEPSGLTFLLELEKYMQKGK